MKKIVNKNKTKNVQTKLKRDGSIGPNLAKKIPNSKYLRCV